MISKKEVQHIAKLARLSLTEKEIKKLQKELSSILDYFEKLKEVDITDVKPTSHSIEIENIFREDEPKRELLERVNKIIEMAPQKEKNYLKVKPII